MNKKLRNKFRSQKWKVKSVLVFFLCIFCETLLKEKQNFENTI